MRWTVRIALAMFALGPSTHALAQPSAPPHQHAETSAAPAAPGHGEQQGHAMPSDHPAIAAAIPEEGCNCCEMMRQMMSQMQAMMQHHGQPSAGQGMQQHQQHRQSSPEQPPEHQEQQPRR